MWILSASIEFVNLWIGYKLQCRLLSTLTIQCQWWGGGGVDICPPPHSECLFPFKLRKVLFFFLLILPFCIPPPPLPLMPTFDIPMPSLSSALDFAHEVKRFALPPFRMNFLFYFFFFGGGGGGGDGHFFAPSPRVWDVFSKFKMEANLYFQIEIQFLQFSLSHTCIYAMYSRTLWINP